MNDDRRLIEDYLPIEDICAESSREKSPRKGHVATPAPLVGTPADRSLPGCRVRHADAGADEQGRSRQGRGIRQATREVSLQPDDSGRSRGMPTALGVGRARFPEGRFGTVSFPDRDQNESVAGRAECAPPRFPSKKMRLSMRTDGQLTS